MTSKRKRAIDPRSFIDIEAQEDAEANSEDEEMSDEGEKQSTFLLLILTVAKMAFLLMTVWSMSPRRNYWEVREKNIVLVEILLVHSNYSWKWPLESAKRLDVRKKRRVSDRQKQREL